MTIRRPAPKSIRELEIRAQALVGHNIGEVAAALAIPLPENPKRAKGFVGTLLEYALGADPTAQDNPDFPNLEVELKSIPISTHGRPAESTFVCSIKMIDADQQTWESSRLRRRLGCVLFIPVQSAKTAPLPQRLFGQPVLWRPSPAQQQLLRADWEELIGYIGAGQSNSLSGHRGQILQVRPKASTSRERVLAPGDKGPESVLPLGFYLRACFTNQILMNATDKTLNNTEDQQRID
ncbi:MAG: DNA mismatch repair protein MutH [Deltaproteobacteria bacterium]|nr:DNA mismatch repair protein MutH [Deltaproteobacteria bacterium]